MSRGGFSENEIIIVIFRDVFSHLNPFWKSSWKNSQKRLITHHEHCLFYKKKQHCNNYSKCKLLEKD